MGATDLPVYFLKNIYLDSIFESGKVKRKLKYFSVPVLLKYKFNNSIYFKGGIQLGLMNQGEDIFTNKVIDKDDLSYTLQVRSQYNPFDFEFTTGVG